MKRSFHYYCCKKGRPQERDGRPSCHEIAVLVQVRDTVTRDDVGTTVDLTYEVLVVDAGVHDPVAVPGVEEYPLRP